MSSVAEKLQRKSQRAVATKQVRLKLVYLDFWSSLKLAFLISVCAGIVLVVASILIWVLLDALQIFHALDGTLQDILDQPDLLDRVQRVARDRRRVRFCRRPAQRRRRHRARRDRQHPVQLQRAPDRRTARRVHQPVAGWITSIGRARCDTLVSAPRGYSSGG